MTERSQVYKLQLNSEHSCDGRLCILASSALGTCMTRLTQHVTVKHSAIRARRKLL